LSRKAVHNWAGKRAKDFADDGDVEMEVRGVAEIRAKRLPFYWFRLSDKSVG
jgi:hypothetical protein